MSKCRGTCVSPSWRCCCCCSHHQDCNRRGRVVKGPFLTPHRSLLFNPSCIGCNITASVGQVYPELIHGFPASFWEQFFTLTLSFEFKEIGTPLLACSWGSNAFPGEGQRKVSWVNIPGSCLEAWKDDSDFQTQRCMISYSTNNYRLFNNLWFSQVWFDIWMWPFSSGQYTKAMVAYLLYRMWLYFIPHLLWIGLCFLPFCFTFWHFFLVLWECYSVFSLAPLDIGTVFFQTYLHF